MDHTISPDNEKFLDQIVASGVFPDGSAALDKAVELLKQRQELLDRIDRGSSQLQSGNYTDFDREGLRQFFDQVQARGEQRYRESR